jgi:hypothetical protein
MLLPISEKRHKAVACVIDMLDFISLSIKARPERFLSSAEIQPNIGPTVPRMGWTDDKGAKAFSVSNRRMFQICGGTLGKELSSTHDVGSGIDDRYRVARTIGDSIRHAEQFHAPAIIIDPSGNRAMQDRVRTFLDREIAHNRAAKNEVPSAGKRGATADGAVKRNIFLDHIGAVDVVMDCLHVRLLSMTAR